MLAREHPERVLALDIAPPWPQPAIPAPRHLALPVLAGYQVVTGTPVLGARLLTSGPVTRAGVETSAVASR